MLVSPSVCLQCFVLLSSVVSASPFEVYGVEVGHRVILSSSTLIQLTFTGALTSGLMLLLAPEEPGWDLGGGVSFILYPGIAMLVLAVLTIVVAVLGCLSIRCDSKTGLYSVSYACKSPH